MNQITNKQEEESPILKKWSNVYALVIGVLIFTIGFLYVLTQHFK